MESEHIKAAGNKIKGKLKEEFGEATDNLKMQAEGHADQAKAKAQDAVGDAKDAME